MGYTEKLPNGRYKGTYRTPEGRERSRTFDRKTDADRFWMAAETDKARGDWVDPALSRRLFKDVAAEWQKAQVHVDTTAATVDSDLRKHILPAFGEREIGKVRHSEVQAFVKRLSEILAPGTVERIYRWLAAIFRMAVNDDLIRKTPCFAIALPKKPEGKVEPLREAEVDALLASLPPRYRALAIVGAGAGLRQGEAFGLTVPHVDFIRGRSLRVSQQLKLLVRTPPFLCKPKTPSSVRTIPLSELVLNVLARHLELFPATTCLTGYASGKPEALVFTDDDGNPLRRTSFSAKVWVPARRAASLPESVTYHDLRHYYASYLIHEGASPKAIQARLGHKSITETFDTYGHLWPDDEDFTRKAVDKILGPSIARLAAM